MVLTSGCSSFAHGGLGAAGGPAHSPGTFRSRCPPTMHPTSDVWAKAGGARAAPTAANTNKCSLMFVSLGVSLPVTGLCEQRGADKAPQQGDPVSLYLPHGHGHPSPLIKRATQKQRAGWEHLPKWGMGDIAPYPSASRRGWGDQDAPPSWKDAGAQLAGPRGRMLSTPSLQARKWHPLGAAAGCQCVGPPWEQDKTEVSGGWVGVRPPPAALAPGERTRLWAPALCGDLALIPGGPGQSSPCPCHRASPCHW